MIAEFYDTFTRPRQARGARRAARPAECSCVVGSARPAHPGGRTAGRSPRRCPTPSSSSSRAPATWCSSSSRELVTAAPARAAAPRARSGRRPRTRERRAGPDDAAQARARRPRRAAPTGTRWPRRRAAARPAPSWRPTRTPGRASAPRPPGARLLVLGEAPGAQEDATGSRSSGAAGSCSTCCSPRSGGERARRAVLNTLKCRPPGNRPPTPRRDRRTCRGWTERQLAARRAGARRHARAVGDPLVPRPGRRSAPCAGGCTRSAGRRVLPTYHPSAALRCGPRGRAAPAAARGPRARRAADREP